jgi:hypothetical protein
MISYYRLGDLVLLHLSPEEERKLLDNHPNTIGSSYIHSREVNAAYVNKIKLITDIVVEYSKANRHLLPTDINNSVVIHVRLGDVVAGTTHHESVKRPHSIQYLQEKLNDCGDLKRYVIGACFFAESSSTNVDECRDKSNLYLNAVLNETNATHLNSGVADIDLCSGVLAKQFIQGKGFFSQLIVNIRKDLNLPSIECNTC